MAKRSNEIDGSQRFDRLLQHVTTRLVGAMVGAAYSKISDLTPISFPDTL